MNKQDRHSNNILLSVVMPVFNEASILGTLTEAVKAALSEANCQFEIVYINDGSRDGSEQALDELAARYEFVKVVHLSRNFGHQAAVQAGLQHGHGDVFVVMDSDMQDVPNAIPDLLDKWREGYDIVYAIRKNRKEHPIKQMLFLTFYRLLNYLSVVHIPNDAGNFGVIDGKVAHLIADFKECDRYYAGLRSWVGFRQIGIEVERGARYDDEPRVSLMGLFALAKNAIFSFSAMPLLLFYAFAAMSLLTFFLVASYALFMKLFIHIAVPGWTSTVMIGCIFGSLNSLGIAVLGEYIARIYNQVRDRPSFIVGRTVNMTFERTHSSGTAISAATPTAEDPPTATVPPSIAMGQN